MASSKTAPAPAIVTLSVLALSIALAGCQRTEPLPAEKTLALIKPVARVEVSEAPAAVAPAAPASAAAAPAVEPAASPAAAPATALPTPAASPVPAAQKGGAGGRMVLGEVAFEGSGAALPGEAGATVESVANYVTANPGVRIEIATHADQAGADLAKERAQAVRAALLGAGVKEDQVVVGAPAAGDEKAAQRVELLLAVSAAAAPAAAAPAAAAATGGGSKAEGKGIYDKTCVTCHSTGVAGAPKVGDKAAWAPRLAGGVGPLVQSALKGKGAMPPKGGNAALSEAEIKAAVEHMVASSK